MSTIATQASPLLRLPPELRNAIYAELIRRPDPNRIDIFNIRPNAHDTVGHPLTQTCRQIRIDFKLFHESEGPAWVETVCFKYRIPEIFNLRTALAKLPLKADGVWRDLEVHLIVDHDTFRKDAHLIRKLVWEEDPGTAFGIDVVQCLRITLHKDTSTDDIGSALEHFSLNRPHYLRQGYNITHADKRWLEMWCLLRDAIYRKTGHSLLHPPLYAMRKAAGQANTVGEGNA